MHAAGALIFCVLLISSYGEGAFDGLQKETSGRIARNALLQIPVILLGMLGVDEAFQGQGLGRDLLLDAVRRAESVACQIGARAIVVDPIDDSARAFYERYGFRLIPRSGRMFAKLG